MLATLVGLVAALIFSFVTYALYGLEGVMTQQWIDQVFWAIIATGILIGFINAVWRCLPCEIGKKLHSRFIIDLACSACRH